MIFTSSDWRSFDGLHQVAPQFSLSSARRATCTLRRASVTGNQALLPSTTCVNPVLRDSQEHFTCVTPGNQSGKPQWPQRSCLSFPPAKEPCTYNRTQSRKSDFIVLFTLSSHFTFSSKISVSTQLSTTSHWAVSRNLTSLAFVQDRQNLSSVSVCLVSCWGTKTATEKLI